MIKWYVGVVESLVKGTNPGTAIVFPYSGKVIESKFGDVFVFAFGGYKTVEEAVRVACYQGYRPSIQLLSTVRYFQKLRKKY